MIADSNDYFLWLEAGSWIRVTARAIILNAARDKILLEQAHQHQNSYVNFIGGGVEVGEALQGCIERELDEETDAVIASIRYLFVVENFYQHKGELRHTLGHYFEVSLVDELVTPLDEGTEFRWVPIGELAGLDLRPFVVRDAIIDGSFQTVKRLIAEP